MLEHEKLAAFLEGIEEKLRIPSSVEEAAHLLPKHTRPRRIYDILAELLSKYNLDFKKPIEKQAILEEGIFPYMAAGGVGLGTHMLKKEPRWLPFLTAILTLAYLKEKKREELSRVAELMRAQEKPLLPFS